MIQCLGLHLRSAGSFRGVGAPSARHEPPNAVEGDAETLELRSRPILHAENEVDMVGAAPAIDRRTTMMAVGSDQAAKVGAESCPTRPVGRSQDRADEPSRAIEHAMSAKNAFRLIRVVTLLSPTASPPFPARVRAIRRASARPTRRSLRRTMKQLICSRPRYIGRPGPTELTSVESGALRDPIPPEVQSRTR